MGDQVVTTVRDEGLGNSSYLVDLGDGRALAVDACRDLRALRREEDERGLRIVLAADTHLHADFLSGAVQLAATAGVGVIASVAGGRDFPHVGLEDGQDYDLGGLTLRALATPGHTGEHLAYLLLDGSTVLGVFTGGSLIAGSAARTDLVDPARTEELARAQFRSLRRLAELEDAVAVWPTHGAGSFCSAGPAPGGRSTTIGHERSTNPMMAAPDEDTFVRLLVDLLGTFPPYFLRLSEENRRGPAVLPPVLGVEGVAPSDADSLVVDIRPTEAFAAGHPEGALSIPLRPAFASWLGWLVPHDRPLLVLREQGQDLDEVLWQAAKIGYTNIVGEIAGGFGAWQAAGLPVAATPLRTAYASGDRVVDVRQRSEFVAGHVAGAVNIELGALESHADWLPAGPFVVMCGHGERALGAASILARAGFDDVTVLAGGPGDWAEANGTELETGS